MIRFALLFLCLALLQPHWAQANTPPIPKSKKRELYSINQKLESQKSKTEELEKEVKAIKGDLKNTQKDLVTLGRSIQDNERQLQRLENDIKDKEVEKLKIENDLQKDHQSIARLILALQRIKRVPPEALIVKPGAPLETAQSAMLMSDIIPSLYKDAENLKTSIADLERLSSELEKERDKVLKISKSLNLEHEKLSKLTAHRKKLYSKTTQDLSEQKAYVEKISTQAKNLNELVKKLENDKKRKKTRDQSRKAVLASVKRAIPGLNASQMPVSGFIKLKYNQKDSFGAPSKGIEIQGREGALVVTPMGGKVQFAGPFKNYGKLIIVEHDNGYHSLIAGLEKIDTVVGQNVAAGEPIGTLHYLSNEYKPVLYYELRLNGKPINPAKKLKGIS